MRNGRFETYKEVFDALKAGKKITNIRFSIDQFLYLDESTIRDQTGKEWDRSFDTFPSEYLIYTER